MLQKERLARIEPAITLCLGAHGLALLAGTVDVARFLWVVSLSALVIGALGFAIPARASIVTARGLLAAAASFALASVTGGFSSSITVWFVVAMLIYPVVIERPDSWLYLGWAALWYLALGTVDSPISMGEAMTRASVAALGGYVAWGLGSTSRQLAGEQARVRSELAALKGRFEVAFANASSGMAMIELGGQISHANQALSDFIGRVAGELSGTEWLGVVHPSDRARVAAQTAQLATGEMWSFQEEIRCLHAEGKVVWALLGVAAVTDSKGAPQYFFAHFQDISARVATENSLRANEEYYRALFGRSPIAIWEADYTEVARWLDGLRSDGVVDLRQHLAGGNDLVREGLQLVRLRDANEAALRVVEADHVDDLKDEFPLQAATNDTLDAITEQFVAVWKGDDRVQGEVRARSRRNNPIDGTLHWVASIVDGRPDLSRVVLAFADYTESRRAQEALNRIEERLRAVVSAAPIFFFALDGHGVITFAEGMAMQAIGLVQDDVVGRSAFELFRDSPEVVQSVRRALTGESFTTSMEAGGRVLDARLAPIWEDAEVAGVIGVASDVTERTRATEQLEHLVRSKDQFVASVSHELRTPLTAVVGFAQELRDGYDQFSPDQLETLVALVAEQSVEVADLVEDLLVAARSDVESVAVMIEAVEVIAQIEQVMIAWGDGGSDRIKILGDPVKVLADPVRFRQIMRNLLTNAIRYGGSEVEVELNKIGKQVWVRVRDNGPGLSRRDWDKIFEPYFRADGEAAEASSVGLGLTVSRQLARLMEGDLVYRYEDGWSVFELTLPSD